VALKRRYAARFFIFVWGAAEELGPFRAEVERMPSTFSASVADAADFVQILLAGVPQCGA